MRLNTLYEYWQTVKSPYADPSTKKSKSKDMSFIKGGKKERNRFAKAMHIESAALPRGMTSRDFVEFIKQLMGADINALLRLALSNKAITEGKNYKTTILTQGRLYNLICTIVNGTPFYAVAPKINRITGMDYKPNDYDEALRERMPVHVHNLNHNAGDGSELEKMHVDRKDAEREFADLEKGIETKHFGTAMAVLSLLTRLGFDISKYGEDLRNTDNDALLQMLHSQPLGPEETQAIVAALARQVAVNNIKRRKGGLDSPDIRPFGAALIVAHKANLAFQK